MVDSARASMAMAMVMAMAMGMATTRVVVRVVFCWESVARLEHVPEEQPLPIWLTPIQWSEYLQIYCVANEQERSEKKVEAAAERGLEVIVEMGALRCRVRSISCHVQIQKIFALQSQPWMTLHMMTT